MQCPGQEGAYLEHPALGMKQMPVRAKDGLRETIKSFAGKIN